MFFKSSCKNIYHTVSNLKQILTIIQFSTEDTGFPLRISPIITKT